jgi:TRAP-type mannitol/chloroaromatic compound transport system permease large subunit
MLGGAGYSFEGFWINGPGYLQGNRDVMVMGASVTSMGIISLPVMLRYGYQKELSLGTIAAAGTLGQIIPPSIVLVVLGDQLGVSVGALFHAAVIPGLVLAGAYGL